MMRGYDPRPRPVALFATLVTLASLLQGCGAAAKTIVLDIGTEIAVSVGAEFIKKIISSDESDGHPTLVISYTNADGYGVGAVYAVGSADAIAVKIVKGSVHLANDGNGLAITVDPGTTATVEITSAGGAGGGAGGGGGSGGRVVANAEDQAATVNGIIRWSGQSRSLLFEALADLKACRNLVDATDDLRRVAKGRASQIDALDELDVSALPKGLSIRATLLQALRYSLEADRAFVRWGEYMQRSRCRKDDNFAQAASLSGKATATKKRFVSAWNPIARGFGLPEYEDTEV